MRDQGLDAYLDALAARSPGPAGGVAAALTAAQAAALVAMVARFTTGVRYDDHADTVASVIERADALRARAVALMDDDVAAFAGVAESQRLPRGTDPERAARARAVAGALVAAAGPQADVVRVAGEVLEMAERLLPIANRSVFADLAAAAQAVRSAAGTARLNVEVDVGDSEGRDADAHRAAIADVDDLLRRADALVAAVRAGVVP
jgi:formiminotetrahydrofolate cyclodeaminase